MNYLTVINRYGGKVPHHNILFSGCDEGSRKLVLHQIIHNAARAGKALVVVDNENLLHPSDLEGAGYRVRNGLAGEFMLCDPFNIDTPQGMIRFRNLMGTLGCNELQKGALVHYMNFLAHVEGLDKVSRIPVTLELLGRYSTVSDIENRLQQLMRQGIITPEEQIRLLTKYSEISTEAADFEKMLYILVLFLQGEQLPLDTPGLAVMYPLRDLDDDAVFCSVLSRLLAEGLNKCRREQVAVLVLDRGFGKRDYISGLTFQLPEVERHLLSRDLFTLDSENMTSLKNRFDVKLYTRHEDMDSCAAVEKAAGSMQVVEQTRAVQYDRRWRANSPWDIMLGNNKTDIITTGAPTWKPRHPKETIYAMSNGLAIIETGGVVSLVNVGG